MQEIIIDIGVCTALTINLSDVDFSDISEVIFTVKNFASTQSPVIIERTFTEAKVHDIIISPEESIQLSGTPEYDFDMVLTDGTRLKMTDNGVVRLRKGVGDCVD